MVEYAIVYSVKRECPLHGAKWIETGVSDSDLVFLTIRRNTHERIQSHRVGGHK